MSLLLVFSVVLLAAVLVSALAHRTVLSTAVLFLSTWPTCAANSNQTQYSPGT